MENGLEEISKQDLLMCNLFGVATSFSFGNCTEEQSLTLVLPQIFLKFEKNHTHALRYVQVTHLYLVSVE